MLNLLELSADNSLAMEGAKHFLNVGDAADYLGVSAASLRNWSDQGRVPVYRTPGGQRRYRLSDLEAFVESWREEPAATAPRDRG
jgi:excisionase family DNA binding protein